MGLFSKYVKKRSYAIKIISPDEKDRLVKQASKRFERKADIYGVCIALFTDNKEFKDMWEDNFDSMGVHVRPHGRIIEGSDPKMPANSVLYEPTSKTAFYYNSDYYGWVKSLALAIAGDFLEDYLSIHVRGSVHGACIDFAGRGIVIIAPSKTGKTTLSYGLMQDKKAKLITDDWFYVKLSDTDAQIHRSERNSYIQKDLAENWQVFEPLVKTTQFDIKQRGIANVEEVLGPGRTRDVTVLDKVFILKRDPKDTTTFSKMSIDDAMKYLRKNNFCNPHFLIEDKRKTNLRINFFREFLSKADIFLINTIQTPQQTLEQIRTVIK